MNRRRLIILAAGGWAGLQAVRGVAGSSDVDMHSLLGKRAPDFAAVDTQGRKRQLSEFKGKAVVLEWTSPSCPFVKAQYQSGVMQEAQKMAAGKGVAWLTILSTHPTRRDYLAADKAEAFNRNRGAVPAALLLDPEGTMGRVYGAVVTPQMFIIDAAGNVVYSGAPTDKSTMDAKQVRVSRNLIKAALDDLGAGRTIATPTSRPFGCTIAYSGR